MVNGTILLCPLCNSEDFDLDDDGVIIYCHNCGENGGGYRPKEISLEEYGNLLNEMGEYQ